MRYFEKTSANYAAPGVLKEDMNKPKVAVKPDLKLLSTLWQKHRVPGVAGAAGAIAGGGIGDVLTDGAVGPVVGMVAGAGGAGYLAQRNKPAVEKSVLSAKDWVAGLLKRIKK